jgi:hypothetical protein
VARAPRQDQYAGARRVLLRGYAQAEEAWRDIQALISWNPFPVNVELLNRARVIENKYRLSWWDSQIVAAAQAQGCAMLLTEDLQDGAIYDGVVARNPFVLGVSEEHMAYALAPKSAARYRGRGRPRIRQQRVAGSS